VLSRLIGGFRLVLLLPLYIGLVLIDEPARWIALGLYLVSVLAGWIKARIEPQDKTPERIGDVLLTLVMTVGLAVGGVTTIGSAAACAVLVGCGLMRLAPAPVLAPGFDSTRLGSGERAIKRFAVLSFALTLAPRIAGVPPDVDTHHLGGVMLLVCGGLAFMGVMLERYRLGRIAVILSE